MEKNIRINIINIVGDALCIEAESGEKVFQLIKKILQENKKVTLSFLNIKMLTTAFLNTAIGKLYKDFSEDKIRDNIKIEDISQNGLIALKRVVETAKLFYKDPDAMQKSIDEILEE